MRTALPSSKSTAAALAAGGPLGAATGEAVLEQVLAAHRTGTLDQLLRQRPRATRWFVRRYVAPVLEATGDAFDGDGATREAVLVLLRWALARLRPDAAALDAPIERAAWLDLPAWRPLLALGAHYGFVAVPEFRHRYHARADEPAAEQLMGLWDVAPSSLYRYVEKGRRLLADVLLDQPLPPERLIALLEAAHEAARQRLNWPHRTAQCAWHARQAEAALRRGGPHAARAALWHRVQAHDAAGATALLQRHGNELAADAATDALLQRLPGAAIDGRANVRLLLARATLARARGAPEQERRLCEQALRQAAADDDKLMLGIASAALGKYHEARDADRSFACYRESAEFLEHAGDGAEVAPASLVTLVHLGWLYALRKDPRAQAVLDRAQALREQCQPPDEVAALLEQARGEYERRAGNLARALEAQHRALQIHERTGHLGQVLRTCGNLALLYGQAQDHARAIEYSQRVLEMARSVPVDPETVASTHINLGIAYFWQDRLDEAIEHYALAAGQAREARLRVVAGRAHYNLAEAYYLRFKAQHRADDERLGDEHVAAALEAMPDDGDPASLQAARELKAQMLGAQAMDDVDRLLPGEMAAHFDETREVQQLRARLALPHLAPAERVAAQLAIAAAYVAIAVKEREAAVALIDTHGLHGRFDAALAGLRDRFERELTREQRLAARWAREAGDLLALARTAPLLRELADGGSIAKSGYAELCGVSPATASKHLKLLAERGLLLQSGRGPSTRYALPP